MKKYILILALTLSAFLGFSQETPPVAGPNFKVLSTSQFYIALPDSAIWQYKGATYGWERLGRYKDVRLTNGRVDSLVTVLNINSRLAPFNVKDFGAKGDAKVITDGVITASSTTITSASANFTNADVGKTIGIPYAGADNGVQTIGRTFTTTIASVTNSTTAVLNAAPVKSIAGARTATGVSMTLGSNILTITSGSFTASDIGKMVSIPGAGEISNGNAGYGSGTYPTDSTLTCWIYAVNSSTQALVTKFALKSVSGRTVALPGAWVEYGTDDRIALQAAIDSAVSQKRNLVLNKGRYLYAAALIAKSNLSMYGEGAGKSILSPIGYGFSAIEANNHTALDSINRNISFSNFEIDGMGVTVNTYATRNKGFYIRPVINGRWDNLYVHNTSATGIGVDFMQNYTITNTVVEHCGRQGWEFTANAGGAGIGVGTGLFSVEDGSISNNFAINNYSNGIFVEGQTRGEVSTGIKIYGNASKWNGVSGIADFGTNGTIISNNWVAYNTAGIRSGVAPFQAYSNINYAKNGTYINNTILDNSVGVYVESKYMGHKIFGNHIYNERTSGTYGIRAFTADTTGNGNIRDLHIENNIIHNVKGNGISIEPNALGESYGSVFIKNNTLYNNGLSTGSPSSAIAIRANIPYLFIKNNEAYDTRAPGSKTQSYGVSAAAHTITTLDYGGNNFLNNSVGPEILTALTIGTSIYQPTYERVGVFTANQTFPNINTTNITNSTQVSSPSYISPTAMAITSTGVMTINSSSGNSIVWQMLGVEKMRLNSSGRLQVSNLTAGTTADSITVHDNTSKELRRVAYPVTDAIVDAVTAIAPSQNAVFDALALKQPSLNGTGFVKISGSTISYDNSTYLTTSSASSIYEPIFSKNTAFNKNFGTGSGTVAEGNDSRIVNAVPSSRNLSVIFPLTGGGGLSADRSFGADTSSVGLTTRPYLASNFYTKTQVDALIPASTSGTYTPTLSAGSNISSVTPRLCHYIRVGDQVTVMGYLDCSTTLTSTSSVVYVSLPIASNLGADEDLSGQCTPTMTLGGPGSVSAYSTGDQALINFTSVGAISGTVRFSFMYTIIP